MTQILMSGWLLEDTIRACVCGRDVDAPQDMLPGARLMASQGHRPPWAQPDPGASMPVMRAPDDAGLRARLDHMTAAFGGAVMVAGHQVFGLSPHGAGDTPWHPPADSAQMIAPMRDVMAQMGRVPPRQMPGHFGAALGRRWSRHLAGQTGPVTRGDTPDLEGVTVLAQEPGFVGFFRHDTVRVRVPQFDGTLSPAMDREVHLGADAALVLPYDPQTDRVLLIEQFRFGPWGRGDRAPWKLEPVAGLIDPGETPETSALREMREETGLDLSRLEPMAHGYNSPGYSTGYFHCYVGLCDLPETGGWVAGAATEHENIRSHIYTFDQAMDMIDTGEIDVLPLTMMLLWLARNRDRLRGGG